MRLWKPWVSETRAIINEYGRYIFAALVLNGLVLANVALVLFILRVIKEIVWATSRTTTFP